VWFPVNYLLLWALHQYYRFLGDDFRVEFPTGSSTRMSLADAAAAVRSRLLALFLPDGDGRRPVFGGDARFGADGWRDQLLFFEYFDGDTGKGLGASHQTGWTGLVADLVLRQYGRATPDGR